MGTIAQKLEYLNDTRLLLKDNINKINNVLDDNSTFRSYPQELFNGYLDILNNGTDTLWNNLEKVSQTGTEAVLEGVETAPIKMVLNGNTSQDTTTGKNLLEYTLSNLKTINTNGTWDNNVYTYNGVTYTINEDLTILVNGTSTANSVLIISNNLSLANGSEYILNGCPSGGSTDGYSIRIYGGSTYKSDRGGSLTFTYENQDLIRVNMFTGTTVDNLVFKPMVRLSSIADDTYEPYTGGIPSPNPDYPQEVKVVKGENVVSVSGKNLFNYLGEHTNVPELEVENTSNGNKLIYTGSKELTRAKYCSFILLDLRNYIGKTIRAKANMTKSGNNRSLIRLFTSNLYGVGTTKATTSTSGNTISFVVPELTGDQIYLGLSLYVNTDGGTAQPNDYVEYTDVIVTIDNEDMDYAPYSKTDYPINLVSKNKLDLSKIVKGRLDDGIIGYESDTISLETTNNKLTFATNTNYRGVTTDYIEIKNSNFIFFDWLSKNNDNSQVFVAYYDKDKNYISQTSGYSLTNAFRFSNNVENSKYIRVYISLTTAGEITIQEPQVEFVSDVSEFEEYFNIELCKINTYKDFPFKAINGDEYYDTLTDEQKNALVYGKWYVHKDIGKKIFDGSESWSRSGTSQSTEYFRFRTSALQDLVLAPSSSSVLMSAYCDLFVIQTANDTYKRIEGISAVSNGQMDIYYEPLKEYTASEFKTWLSNNNVTLYYVLATPTEEEITNTTLIEQLEAIYKAKSVKDKTYITQTNDDLPFILDVEAIKEYEVV